MSYIHHTTETVSEDDDYDDVDWDDNRIKIILRAKRNSSKRTNHE